MNAVAVVVLISISARAPAAGHLKSGAPARPGPAQARSAAPKKNADRPSPAESANDPKEAAERVVQLAKDAGKRLDGKDPGAETRQLQAEVLKNLDALINQVSNPPPQPNQAGQPPPTRSPSGGSPSAGPPSPEPGSASGRRNKSRSSRQDRTSRGGSAQGPPAGEKPGSGQQPSRAGGGGSRSGNTGEQAATAMAGRSERPSPPGHSDRMSDLYKDVWGHLPERLRQEMDLYYRERFMPRYQDLLRQYYSSLAERRRASDRE